MTDGHRPQGRVDPSPQGHPDGPDEWPGRVLSAEERQLQSLLIELAEAGVPAGEVDLWPALRSRWQTPEASPRRRRAGVAGFGPPVGLARAVFIALIAGALVLTAAGTTLAVSRLLRVFDPGRVFQSPEEASEAMSQAVDPPLTLPQDTTDFYQIDPRQAAAETGSALAYLSPPPSGMSEQIDVSLPMEGRWSPEEEDVALAVRSMVRYRGDGHTLLVALDEPSAAMAAEQLILGDKAVSLPDGRPVWSAVQPNQPLPNLVTMVWDPYIVAIATDLSLDAALQLAERVDVIPATRTGSGPAGWTERPKQWPTAVPAVAVESGAVAISGGVQLVRDGGQSHLRYHLAIGNPGTRAANDVAVVLELPAACQEATGQSTIPVPIHPATLAPQDLVGVGADIPLDLAAGRGPAVAQALAEGIVARVSWRDGALRQERAFVIHPDE